MHWTVNHQYNVGIPPGRQGCHPTQVGSSQVVFCIEFTYRLIHGCNRHGDTIYDTATCPSPYKTLLCTRAHARALWL